MTWKKLGLIFTPAAVHPKLSTHAANPLALPLEGDVYRVLYSGRDAQNRSSVGFVDVNILRREIVRLGEQPLFEHGPSGSFYSHGVSIGNCYEADSGRYILFMGWQCPPGEHWRGDIGRLVLQPDLSLQLDGNGPFMSTDTVDSISLSYPWVHCENAYHYHMWYGSTITWDGGNGEMVHVINHASSTNGHHWNRDGLAIPYKLGTAQAFSRPSVIGNSRDGYRMWFSYRSGRGEKYRIGYATSPDGSAWTRRLEEAGITVSPTGWDSEMVEYPYVFEHKGQLYMLYNGNGHGRTGFGLAMLE